MDNEIYDICIIGGGINGVGIAAEAAARSLKVILCEKDDLAHGTSQWSSKLIHGGLRYLEHYEFSLVRKALLERQNLLEMAPHLIKPIPFVMPHHPDERPRWQIRLGLFLYDYLGKRHFPSRTMKIQDHAFRTPLRKAFQKGFIYSDCQVDDARLVVINAIAAREKGAKVKTRCKVLAAETHKGSWHVTYKDKQRRETHRIQAKVLVNASGPWVQQISEECIHCSSNHSLKLVKGSHIVVKAFYPGEHAYILQNKDKRVVFVMPYLGRYSLIGTTDVAYEGSLEEVEIQQREITYLCQAVNHYFSKTITSEDILWHYSGVRPLQANPDKAPSEASRDYLIHLEEPQQCPIATIIGGKITTFRLLACETLRQLTPYFPHIKPAPSALEPLPGGDLKYFQERQFRQRYNFLPQTLLQHYLDHYGTRSQIILDGVHSLKDLGKEIEFPLFEKEVDYLIKEEWAMTTEDILFRRSKLGIHMDPKNRKKLSEYVKDQLAKFA